MLTLTLILIPLLAGVVTIFSKNNNAKQIALLGALVELIAASAVLIHFHANASVQFGFNYAWIESLGVWFSGGVDGISLLLVVLTGFLTPLIILSTFKNPYKNASTFYALILFMQSALMGVFVANDAFLFYFFFEAALIPVYFLAAIWGGENRIAVTFKFFVYTIFGSLFMLVALVYLYLQTPGSHSSDIWAIYQVKLNATQQCYIFWAFFIAFAIKMPLFPFHTWQPDTYCESPTPATMLMAGIMLKMGVYGLIRFIIPITPLAMQSYGDIAIGLSVIGIIYGSIIAIQQRDIKRLIAYSSFAHVGLMAAGVFSQTVSGIQGALIQAVAHGINVVGLFFIVEIIFSRTKTRNIEQLGGITQRSRKLTIYFVILMLGSVALPLTNGFVGEFLLLKGVYEYNLWLGVLAATTIILGAVYMLRLMQKSMFGSRSSFTEHFADLSMSERLVLAPLAVMVLVMGVYPNALLKLTEPAVTNLLQMVHY